MIYPKLSDGTIDWCVMCKHKDSDFYDLCCECEYPENSDDPPAKYEPKPMTNGERIRRMTDEELVEIFANNYCGYCRIHDFCFAKGSAINCEDVWLDWLREEGSE